MQNIHIWVDLSSSGKKHQIYAFKVEGGVK